MKRSAVVLCLSLSLSLSLGLLASLAAAAQGSCAPAPETQAFFQSFEPNPAVPDLTGVPAPIALTCTNDCLKAWQTCYWGCGSNTACKTRCSENLEVCRCRVCGICP